MNKQTDVEIFFNILEFGLGCFLAGVAVGIVASIALGML